MDSNLRALERSAKLGGREEVEAYYTALTRVGQEISLWSAREAALFGYEVRARHATDRYREHRTIWNWYLADGKSDVRCFHYRKREALMCASGDWQLGIWIQGNHLQQPKQLGTFVEPISVRHTKRGWEIWPE